MSSPAKTQMMCLKYLSLQELGSRSPAHASVLKREMRLKTINLKSEYIKRMTTFKHTGHSFHRCSPHFFYLGFVISFLFLLLILFLRLQLLKVPHISSYIFKELCELSIVFVSARSVID